MATVVFLAMAELSWVAVACLAAGSMVGGYVGARIGRRLPAPVLRGLVVIVGITAAIVMMQR